MGHRIAAAYPSDGAIEACPYAEAGSLVPNKIVIPDHKLYFANVDSREEAHFLAAYLNSRPVREWLGGFLHGRQIATTVFEFMRVPKFDQK